MSPPPLSSIHVQQIITRAKSLKHSGQLELPRLLRTSKELHALPQPFPSFVTKRVVPLGRFVVPTTFTHSNRHVAPTPCRLATGKNLSRIATSVLVIIMIVISSSFVTLQVVFPEGNIATMLIAFVMICLIIFYSVTSAKVQKAVPGPVGVRISVLTRNIVISTMVSLCGNAGYAVFDTVFHQSQNISVFLGSAFLNGIFPLGMCATLWFMLRFLASGSRRNLATKRSTRTVCPSAVSPMKTTGTNGGTTNKRSGTAAGAWTGTVPTGGTVGSPVPSISKTLSSPATSALNTPSTDVRELS